MNDITYAIIYGQLIFASVLGWFFPSERFTKNVIWFEVVLFTLFRGLRWGVGTDWDQYREAFHQIDGSNLFAFYYNGVTRLDSGYALLNFAVKAIGGNYTVFLLLTNLFIMISYAKFANLSQSKLLVFSFLICTTIAFPVRQTLSTSVALFAFSLIDKKKYMYALLIICIATSIHYAAIEALLIFYLFKVRFTFLTSALLIGGSYVVSSPSYMARFTDSVYNIASQYYDSNILMASKLAIYSGDIDYDTASKGVISVLLQLSIIFLFFRFHNKTALSHSLINSYVVGQCLSWVFLASMQELARLSVFFLMPMAILLGNTFSGSKKLRPLIGVAIYILMISRFMSMTYNYQYASELIPYRSIFSAN